jgi:hypothetical protein
MRKRNGMFKHAKSVTDLKKQQGKKNVHSLIVMQVHRWSVSILISKGPKRVKNSFTTVFVVISAVCDGKEIISTHFVNWSTMTNILLLPLFVSGKGPKKSIWTRSIGAPA